MSKPILYYAIISPPVRAVLLTAKAIGLELELKEINLGKGEHLSEEYLKINPQHTVPTLIDDGKTLWDSHAINTYLIGKYAKDDSLYPNDLYQRALINQRLFFDCSVLFTGIAGIVGKVLRQGQSRITDEQEESVINSYTLLETFLKEADYMVGNSLTVADLSASPIITSVNGLVPIDGNKFPKLIAYIERMSQLPYFDEINKEASANLANYVKKTMKDNIRLSFDRK